MPSGAHCCPVPPGGAQCQVPSGTQCTVVPGVQHGNPDDLVEPGGWSARCPVIPAALWWSLVLASAHHCPLPAGAPLCLPVSRDAWCLEGMPCLLVPSACWCQQVPNAWYLPSLMAVSARCLLPTVAQCRCLPVHSAFWYPVATSAQQ